MLMSTMSTVVHRIERFLDLLPEPLVLRAMDGSTAPRGRIVHGSR